MVELPFLTPTMVADVSSPDQLASAESSQQVKDLLKESGVRLFHL
jgi:hypothetical protein